MKEKTKENEEVIERILKKCNLDETIIVKENRNFILKIYHNMRKDIINEIL